MLHLLPLNMCPDAFDAQELMRRGVEFSGEGYKVEVKEPPQGVTPPTQHTSKKVGHQPNKVGRITSLGSCTATSSDNLLCNIDNLWCRMIAWE